MTLVLGVATLYSPLLYVALAGFEPATTGFKVLRTTNCATGQFFDVPGGFEPPFSESESDVLATILWDKVWKTFSLPTKK